MAAHVSVWDEASHARAFISEGLCRHPLVSSILNCLLLVYACSNMIGSVFDRLYALCLSGFVVTRRSIPTPFPRSPLEVR